MTEENQHVADERMVHRTTSGVHGSGHANLDRDHEILYEIVQRLKQGLKGEAEDRELIGSELLAYTDAHFEHEEELMDRHRFPGAPAHKLAHQKFRTQLEGMVRTCAAPDAPLEPLVLAIENWFEIHIREVDARFAEFLMSKNVETCPNDEGIFSDSDAPRSSA